MCVESWSYNRWIRRRKFLPRDINNHRFHMHAFDMEKRNNPFPVSWILARRVGNLEISWPRVSIMEQTLPPRNCRCKQRFSSWLYTELKALLRTRSNERGGCLACHFRNANICALIVSFEYPFFPPPSPPLSLSLLRSVSSFVLPRKRRRRRRRSYRRYVSGRRDLPGTFSFKFVYRERVTVTYIHREDGARWGEGSNE